MSTSKRKTKKAKIKVKKAATKKPKKVKKVKKTKKTKKPKKVKYDDPNILEIVEKEIELTCPIRGKIKRVVKVKILRPVQVEHKQFIEPSDYVDKIDEDGPIYGATESEEEGEDKK